jgi:hypothetical protein
MQVWIWFVADVREDKQYLIDHPSATSMILQLATVWKSGLSTKRGREDSYANDMKGDWDTKWYLVQIFFYGDLQ